MRKTQETIKIKKLHPEAKLPTYGTDGAACFDLTTIKDVVFNRKGDIYEATVETGLAFEVPVGKVLKLYPRSGTGFKYLIQLGNGTGIIDSDYRGEVKVKLISIDENLDIKNRPNLIFPKGSRVCQGMIEEAPRYNFIEVQELSNTERGKNGFGSTGK